MIRSPRCLHSCFQGRIRLLRSRSRLQSPLKMLPAPRPNGRDAWAYSFSMAGDAVLDPRRDLRVDRAPNKSFFLQIAKRCGQYIYKSFSPRLLTKSFKRDFPRRQSRRLLDALMCPDGPMSISFEFHCCARLCVYSRLL